jgi:hypothetical protein
MINLIRAEFRKLFTTQVWFWLLVASLALTALQVIVVVANTDDQAEYIRNGTNTFSGAGNSTLFVMVLGIIGITAEFRHQTITPTLLATPSRLKVVGGKLITYLLLGAAYAAAGIAATVGIALPWLSAKGIDASLSDPDVPRTLIASFVVVSLYALLGVGIGSLLTNQAAAITLSIVYFAVIETLVMLIPGVREVYPYLPGAASSAMLVDSTDRVQENFTFLSPPAGAAVFVLWALAFSAVGVWRMRRDVS